MKKLTIKRITLGLAFPLCIFTACDYLDVVPPEQATTDDTMKNQTDAVNFINSCYMAVEFSAPFTYNTYEWSTDESVDPPLWNSNNQKTAWNLWSSTDAAGYWDNYYNYIGHCHMFQSILAKNDPLGSTEADKARWNAEAEFLKAYYHSRLLAMYGPIPIVDQRPAQSTLPQEFAGRSHYDFVVDYIVDKLDLVVNANALPPVGTSADWGRATSTAAKAIKGRVLLYAASDLWNGKFPYTNWRNTNYETPEYGKELVSFTPNPQKWQRALDANLDALKYAENEGQRKLITIESLPTTLSNVPIPYIPGVDTAQVQGKEFAKRVLLMRSIVNSNENENNKETIWGVFMQGDRSLINFAPWPKRIIQYNSAWIDGWCAISPTLYSVEHFYTKDGKIPALDPQFSSKNEWLQSANLKDRPEVIKLNVNREPRFYANFSFDGDDYSPLICNGEPLRVNLRDGGKQGYNPSIFNRDFTVTGYFSKKYTSPDIRISSENGKDNRRNFAKPLFRLAELYLNVAECYAALKDETNALKYLNPIRERAGISALTDKMIEESGISIMDWVRNERFVELWGEGHRYYDVRRWMIAPQQLKPGAYEGLDVEGAGISPTFTKLNQRVVINQQFQWNNRMYLWPIKSGEIYNDPQLVQAPEY